MHFESLDSTQTEAADYWWKKYPFKCIIQFTLAVSTTKEY